MNESELNHHGHIMECQGSRYDFFLYLTKPGLKMTGNFSLTTVHRPIRGFKIIINLKRTISNGIVNFQLNDYEMSSC